MILLAFAEGATWYNYPGLELWKFVNLAIFTAVGIYILRRPISQALGTRREAIKQELVQAQNKKAEAVAKLAEAESLLTRLDSEVRNVQEHARQEVESERDRVAASTSREIEKLKQQAEREIETADKLARKSCGSFSPKEVLKSRARRYRVE